MSEQTIEQKTEAIARRIFAGDTEASMLQMLYEHGLVDERTKVVERADL